MTPQPQRQIVGITIAENFFPLPIAPIRLIQQIMARTPSEEPKPTVNKEDQANDLKEWNQTALDIMTEIKSKEHRRMFAEIVTGGSEAKRQVCASNLVILQRGSPSQHSA